MRPSRYRSWACRGTAGHWTAVSAGYSAPLHQAAGWGAGWAARQGQGSAWPCCVAAVAAAAAEDADGPAAAAAAAGDY